MAERSGTQLRRNLGLLETTVGGVGIILGAGIYVLVGEVAGKSGDALWVSFLMAGGMAAIIGLSYAELSSAFPRAGADYEYTRQALGARTAFVVGWLIVIGNLVAAAAVALGFGRYLDIFWDIAPHRPPSARSWSPRSSPFTASAKASGPRWCSRWWRRAGWSSSSRSACRIWETST